MKSSPSCITPPKISSPRILWRCLAALLLLAAANFEAQADPDFTITKSVWKKLYGVTDTQINDPVWLANDADGDGVSNGDELASGTDPFKAGSALKVTTITGDASNVYLTFPTQMGKLYVVQQATNLKTGPWSALTPNVQVMGDGNSKMLTASKAGGSPFFRVLVQDIDSTGDQVGDWAKQILGLSTSAPITAQSSFDHTSLSTNLQSQDVVTMVPVNAAAVQPPDSNTAPSESGVITVARSGYMLVSSITVPLIKSGTAVEGTDYANLPPSVTFPAGVNSLDITITPLYNASRTTTATVVLTAGGPGTSGSVGNYTLGTPKSASVTVYPSGNPVGTGLTGAYYSGSSSTYASPINFGGGTTTYVYTKTATGTGNAVVSFTGTPAFATGGRVNLQFSSGNLSGGTYDRIYVITAATSTTFTVAITSGAVPASGSGNLVLNPPAVTRLDSTVNFNWGTGSPDPLLFQDNFCVRWTGQVLPQYSEPYTFVVNADDSVRLWINGQQQTLRRGTSDNPSVAYNYTKTSTTTGSAVVTYASAALNVNDKIPLQFSSGNLTAITGSQLYTITAVTSTNFTVSITGTSVPASGTGNVSINTLNLPIDWNIFSSADRYATINLQAGVYYDIKLEYYEGSSNAKCILSWYNADLVKQVIPTNRLFPTMSGLAARPGDPPAAAPAITSATNAAAVLGAGSPFSFTLVASNGGGSFTASGLPSWLTLSNGVLTGTPSAAGIYQFTVSATNAAGTGSAVMTIQVLATGSQLTRELWTSGVTGAGLANVPWSAAPSPPDTVSVAEDNTTTYGANTGERLRGYFTPETTGNYYFWISGSNAAELWISNNAEPVNKLRRAFVSGPTGTASRTWNTQAGQKSAWLSLIAGQKYYLEVLHNTGASGASNNLAVGWFLDPTGSTANPIANGAGPSSGSTGGVVPGYVLSPWDNPPTTTTPGSIYITNLEGASGLSNIKGSGSAYLRVNGSTAVLHLNYSGLTSGAVSRRIYALPVGNNAPQLLFDIDTQDRNYPALKTSDAGYTWNLQSSDLAALNNASVFISIATVNNPGGELAGTFGIITGSQTAPAMPAYSTPADDHDTDAGASRFLTQATFGPSPADITYVKTNGYRAWIENQLTLPVTRNLPYILGNLSGDPQNPYGSNLFFNSWWKNSVGAPDQLRQRLAFALSEILVVSDTGPLNNNGRTLSDYYDSLLDNSFGTYRDLLKQVTLTSAMGIYLDMLANNVGNDQTGLHPNENYAREIMQLFSIGLYRLWPDGSLILDSTGNPVATYDQSVITGMARVFTGWTWGQGLSGGRLPTNFSPSSNYLDPMVLVPSHHELGTKILLDNVVLPAATVTFVNDTSQDPNPNPITMVSTNAALGAGNTVSTSITNSYDLNGLRDLELSIDNIFNNSSIAPYICRQLIQRLVTSNPKPAYVYRVVRAFNGEQNVDGIATGIRGDMKEVIRAILLDPEARSSTAAADIGFGKQREPLLRVTGPARAFPPTGTTGASYRQIGGNQIMVSTSAPHRLTNDTVVLSNFVDSGSSTTNLPPSIGYSVNAIPTYNHTGTTTAAYSNVGTTATITGSGFIPGNKVFLKFTTGSLNNGTYDALYTIVTATATNFTVTLGGSPPNTSGNSQIYFTAINTTGYQIGDVVPIQFTSGTLGSTAPYNTVRNYTVTGILPTAFTVDLGGTLVGTTSGSVVTPNNFTVGDNPVITQTYAFSGTAVTINLSGVPNLSGRQMYVRFSTGSLAGAGFDGLYNITSSDATHVFLTLPSAPTGSTGGNVVIPRLSGGYNITNAGAVSTIAVQTSVAHSLKVGDPVWIDFLVTNTPTGATSQVYNVASAPQSSPNVFTVTVTPAITAGSQSTSGQVVYPLSTDRWTRSGTVNIDFSTWNMSYSQNDLVQTPLDSTTVFNFFYPDYHYPGAMAQAGMTTPEFQLTNDSNTMNLTNTITSGVLSAGNTNGYTSFRGGSGLIVMDLNSYMTPSKTADAGIPALVDSLSVLLTGGNLSAATRTTIINYVANTSNFPYTTPTNTQMRDRVRAIVHLIITSAEYAIQK